MGIAIGFAGLAAIFASRVRSAFIAGLAAADPRLAGRAGALASSVRSGTVSVHGADATGRTGHLIEAVARPQARPAAMPTGGHLVRPRQPCDAGHEHGPLG
jgi:hypothetical protein